MHFSVYDNLYRLFELQTLCVVRRFYTRNTEHKTQIKKNGYENKQKQLCTILCLRLNKSGFCQCDLQTIRTQKFYKHTNRRKLSDVRVLRRISRLLLGEIPYRITGVVNFILTSPPFIDKTVAFSRVSLL